MEKSESKWTEKAIEKRDPFIKDDGWSKTAVVEVGLDEFLSDAKAMSYEIENCRRGVYAGFGDTGEELLVQIVELKETMECVIEEMEAKLA